MGMNDAHGVFTRGVDGAVNGVASVIDLVRRVIEDIALKIDLHKIGRRHLVPAQPERIEQKMVIGTRHTRRNMIVDQRRRPAIQMGESVRRGKIDANLPFIFTDTVAKRRDFDIADGGGIHDLSPNYRTGSLAHGYGVFSTEESGWTGI